MRKRDVKMRDNHRVSIGGWIKEKGGEREREREREGERERERHTHTHRDTETERECFL